MRDKPSVRIACVSSGAAASSIAEVIAHMEAIDGALPRKDGVAIFNRLYLQVTRAVDAAGTGTGSRTGFLERLDVVFAGLYFGAEATINSGGELPRSLAPTRRDSARNARADPVRARRHDRPHQPRPADRRRDDVRASGLAPDDDGPVHRDYQRVDGLLATVERDVAGWFDTGLIADIEDVTPKATDEALAMWSLDRRARRRVGAREAAVGTARCRPLRDAYLAVLAQTTELAARAMLV